MNPLDSLIASINPAAALRRQQARLQLEWLRRYEGASRGRRTEGWRTQSTSADAAAAPALALLRDRSRDLVRNNPYAAKAVGVIVANVVGTGIMGQARTRSRRRAEQLSALYNNWASDPQQCDWHGRMDFMGLQVLAFRAVVESGEALIRRRTPPSASDQRIPLRLQVMEPDMLDATRDVALANGGLIKEGIEYDAQGRRVAYWLYEEHPGEQHLRVVNVRSSRVPASEIIHVYRQDRPHQTRGIPWASPVILRLRDFDDYSDAQLLKQKISACFAAFAVDTEAPDAGLGTELIEKLEPGAIEILPPGKDIRFANPPTVGDFDKVSREYLLQIAAGFGITYESLTGDLSTTNFASGRMGWLEFQRNIEAWRWQLVVPQMLNPIWTWFLQAGAINGLRTDGIVAHWTPPRRELIDPTKEVEGIKNAVRCGLMSPAEAIREFGYEPDEVLAEAAEFYQLADQLGLVLDIDPRKVSGAGQPVQPPNPGNNPQTD